MRSAAVFEDMVREQAGWRLNIKDKMNLLANSGIHEWKFIIFLLHTDTRRQTRMRAGFVEPPSPKYIPKPESHIKSRYLRNAVRTDAAVQKGFHWHK